MGVWLAHMADPILQWAQLLRNAVALAPPGVPQEALDLVHQAASMAASDEGSELEESSEP